MKRLVAALAAVCAASFQPSAAVDASTRIDECVFAGGPTPDAYVRAFACSGPAADGSFSLAGRGCIWVDTAEASYYGCNEELGVGAVLVDPLLGTATMQFAATDVDNPAVTLAASVTLVATSPPSPGISLQDHFSFEDGHAHAQPSASIETHRSGITTPESTITASDGSGGELAVASDGSVSWRLAAEGAAGTASVLP